MITVLLPSYNGMPFIVEALSSFRSQRHREFVLYVVDDASSDASPDVADSLGDPRVRVIRADRNLGIPGNWNRALAQVDTPYFALAHQDDVYEPDYLDTLLALLEAHPDAFVAHCGVRAIDGRGAETFVPAERYKEVLWPPGERYALAPPEAVAQLSRGNYIVMSTVMYRTAAVRAIGPFNERFQFVADWQYWIRGALAGYSIVGTRRRLVRRRWHGGMATRRLERDLTRYREEVELAGWIASERYARKLRSAAGGDYTTIANAILSEVIGMPEGSGHQ